MGQHLGDTYPVARKRHTCYLCGFPISIGQTHVKRVGVWEGDFSWIRMHIGCAHETRDWGDTEWEGVDMFDFRQIPKKAVWGEVWVIDERAI